MKASESHPQPGPLPTTHTHRAAVRAGLAAALIATLLGTQPDAQAAPQRCDTDADGPCTLAFGPLRARFDESRFAFDGDSQQSGADAWVTGYTVGTYDFPPLHTLATPDAYGFWFAPAMAGAVGGSGFSGEHMVDASFTFSGLTFLPEPGWTIDALLMTITGKRHAFGDATALLTLPGLDVTVDGEDFTASGLLPTDIAHFRAGFNLWTAYEEGEDGSAAVYGTARAQFDRVSIAARMTRLAVPEPGSLALLALAMSCWVASARQRQPRP